VTRKNKLRGKKRRLWRNGGNNCSGGGHFRPSDHHSKRLKYGLDRDRTLASRAVFYPGLYDVTSSSSLIRSPWKVGPVSLKSILWSLYVPELYLVSLFPHLLTLVPYISSKNRALQLLVQKQSGVRQSGLPRMGTSVLNGTPLVAADQRSPGEKLYGLFHKALNIYQLRDFRLSRRRVRRWLCSGMLRRIVS
jgi:hypothetical protein